MAITSCHTSTIRSMKQPVCLRTPTSRERSNPCGQKYWPKQSSSLYPQPDHTLPSWPLSLWITEKFSTSHSCLAPFEKSTSEQDWKMRRLGLWGLWRCAWGWEAETPEQEERLGGLPPSLQASLSSGRSPAPPNLSHLGACPVASLMGRRPYRPTGSHLCPLMTGLTHCPWSH